MKVCHVCSTECEDRAELCPLCGAQLRDEETEQKKEIIEIKNPVLAVSVEDVVTAEIYKDVLKDNKIPFFCDDEGTSGMKLIFGGGLVAENIYVDESDLEKAQNIYDEVLNAEPEYDDFDGEEN